MLQKSDIWNHLLIRSKSNRAYTMILKVKQYKVKHIKPGYCKVTAVYNNMSRYHDHIRKASTIKLGLSTDS